MNEFERSFVPDAAVQPPSEAPGGFRPDAEVATAKRARGARLLAIGAFVLLCAALSFGFWRHYSLHAQVMAKAEQRQKFVPSVRVATVRASGGTMSVTWPDD